MMPVSAAYHHQHHNQPAPPPPATTTATQTQPQPQPQPQPGATIIDLNRIPNSALTYTITDASSYLSDFHPANIINDEPTKVNSRWAAAYTPTPASFTTHPPTPLGMPPQPTAPPPPPASALNPTSSSRTQSSTTSNTLQQQQHQQQQQQQQQQPKHYLLLRLAYPAVLRTIRFGKYHKSHATTMRDFKVYAGPTRHASSMTRIVRDSCRDDAKPQDFACTHTDDDGVPFPVRYIRVEPLNSQGVHYNISIWHLALFGISDSHVVQSVQQEYELHRDTKSTRLILKHLRARAHQSAFRALLASSHLGTPLAPHEQLTNGIKRLRNNAVVVGTGGARPFEHPLLSHLFRALIRRDAWDDIERILDLAAFGRLDEVELPTRSDRRSGKQKAEAGVITSTATENEAQDDGEVLFAHFVSRTVPRSVWTAMPVRRALPAPHPSTVESADPTTSSSSSSRAPPPPPAAAEPVRNAPARPGPRAGHQMILDSTKSVVYLFGGWDGVRDLADFWAYDVERATWRCISMDTSQPSPSQRSGADAHPYGLGNAGPIARSCHRMVFDPRTGCIYLLGRFVEFPSANAAPQPQPQPTVVAQPQPQTAATATPVTAGTFQGNQVFQDVMIPSTNLRSQIATTANPGTPTSATTPAIARPASTAGLHSSAQLSHAASTLANSPSMNALNAGSSATAAVAGSSSRLGAGAGGRTGPGAGSSSSLNPSPVPGTSSSASRNVVSPGGSGPGNAGARAGGSTTRGGGGGDASSSAQATHTSFSHRTAGGGGGGGGGSPHASMMYHSRTMPGYECDFWRFSTRTETWTRLSADTSIDDGKGTGNPGPRLVKDHAMAFDSEGQVLFLFGGKVAHPNPSVVEYGGMWRFDIIRRTWTLLFDDDTHFCVPGREGHSMLLDPNLASASSSTGGGEGAVMGMAAALSASMAGPGPLLWIIGGKRDLFLADMWTYNVRTGGIMHLTSHFNIPYGPSPSFTPQVSMDPRPHKREIYFLCAGGEGELGASGECTSLKMWVYSMRRQVWTSVLEPEPAATNAVLAAAAAAAAAAEGGGSGRGGAGGSRPHIRIGPAGFGLDSDGYPLRPSSGSSGANSPLIPGGSGAAPKRQRRRDTLESEYEADEDARSRLMLSSPPASGPLNALPFPSTSARRDEAMMMLMETDGEFGAEEGYGGRAGASSMGVRGEDVGGAAGAGGASLSSSQLLSNAAVSADLYAGLEPRPRWASQMVYDPLREAFYLFGGNPNGAQVAQSGSSSSAQARSGGATGATTSSSSSSADGRVRSRLDDWWRLVLVRPSVEEVLRKTKFLVRKQRFLEMAAGTWEAPMMNPATGGVGGVAPMDLEMSATEGGGGPSGGFFGSGGGG
ncbi:unnamed protein product, partial [Tilletia controversa]